MLSAYKQTLASNRFGSSFTKYNTTLGLHYAHNRSISIFIIFECSGLMVKIHFEYDHWENFRFVYSHSQNSSDHDHWKILGLHGHSHGGTPLPSFIIWSDIFWALEAPNAHIYVNSNSYVH
jgi:hypothetical protein